MTVLWTVRTPTETGRTVEFIVIDDDGEPLRPVYVRVPPFGPIKCGSKNLIPPEVS